MTAMTAAMPTMTSMHEHVQDRTGREKDQRQPPEGVDPVLREKEEKGNPRKCEEHEH